MHPAGVMPPVRPAPILRDCFSGGPALFMLPTTGPAMESEGQSDDAGPPELASDGTGLSALIDYLLRHDRARFNALEDALRQRLPDLKDLTISTPQPAARALTFRMKEGFELPVSRTSVGAQLLVFFLALSYHPSPPGIILLEEPENGVHPRRLEDVLRLLRDITKGMHCGHPAQVILTTHSPYLLDHVNLDEDEVLVFRRNDDGSRTCEPVNRERLKVFLDDFMLGEVWFNQKEEGLIKRDGE